MHMTLAGPIDRLTTDWMVNRTTQSKLALNLLAECESEVASMEVDDLHSLVEKLRESIGKSGENWAPRVLQAMLRAQAVHPLIPRAILQALVPGLVTIARRLSWGTGGEWTDSSAFFADLITTTWEVITEWSGQDRPYALLDLLSATRCRMRRQILRQTHRDLAMGTELERRLSRAVSNDATDLELLARAIDDLRGDELDVVEAAVLYGTRVLGFSMTELSKLTGRSRRYLADRRRHAESQFCGQC